MIAIGVILLVIFTAMPWWAGLLLILMLEE